MTVPNLRPGDTTIASWTISTQLTALEDVKFALGDVIKCASYVINGLLTGAYVILYVTFRLT